ncbi:DUF192 domain-containing protein [Aquimarina sp. RZ0]|uniref:DUF192 domain-containing protein n=1 Tax=Aquimarina sp. RZ0 TaxID=2607730 RepID=UPI0011F18695|nr:DUF192 domain-containing protein [Aquimarina sp. RZ0]KAA1247180.1 DUF192 domain-containing protein [Aquimarina sp. RZ0]
MLLKYTIAVFGIIIFLGCKQQSENTNISTKEILFSKEGELSLYTKKDTIPTLIKKIDIEIADNEYERETGLMYRKSMESNQGMLFIQKQFRPQSFYMKNTLIPLDIIYIDTNFKIVSFQKQAKPLDETSLPSGKPAKYVLEINAGLSDKLNLAVGDSISFKKI